MKIIPGVLYIPAFFPSVFVSILKKYGQKAEQFLWWSKESFFYYPYFLVSAFYGVDKFFDFRKHFLVSEDVFVMGDSGGYQAMTCNKVINPEDSINWLCNNCNVGFVLDYPGESVSIGGRKMIWGSVEEFKYAAYKTLENNQIFQEKRTGSMLIYNILHGRNLSQLNFWFDVVNQVQFEGWAIGMKPPSPFRMIFGAMFLYSKGVKKNVHFLGCSGIDFIPLLSYLSRYIENLTFDSSSFAIGSKYRSFLIYDLRMNIFLGEKAGDNIYNVLPCDCPVCLKIKDVSKLYTTPVAGNILSLHNLYQMLRYVNMLNALTKVDLVRFVEKYIPQYRVLLDYIDCCVEEGFEVATKKFNCLFFDEGFFLEEENRKVFEERNFF